MEKVMEKKFQDHGKVREFSLQSVKMSNFEKVRENQSWSGNFLLLEYTYSSQICNKDHLLPGPPSAFLPPWQKRLCRLLDVIPLLAIMISELSHRIPFCLHDTALPPGFVKINVQNSLMGMENHDF